MVDEVSVPRREKNSERAPQLVEPEQLFQRYHRPIVAFFLRRGFTTEESLDLAQETFLRIFKHIDGFRGESSVETWLFQVASNLYKNTLRSRSTMKRDAAEESLSAPEDLKVGHPLEERSDPLGEVLMEERAQRLREALLELPPQMRRCVILRVEHNLKYREIAELMRVSIETVKAHLYQGRQLLREKLADQFSEAED